MPTVRCPPLAESIHPGAGGKLCVTVPHTHVNSTYSTLIHSSYTQTASRYGSSSLAGWCPFSLFPSSLPNRHDLPNSWTRCSSEYLGKLTEGFYIAGRPDDTASSMLELVGHATPDQVFARISRSGDITVPRDIERPSSCGPATLVGNTVCSPSVASCGRLLIRRL